MPEKLTSYFNTTSTSIPVVQSVNQQCLIQLLFPRQSGFLSAASRSLVSPAIRTIWPWCFPRQPRVSLHFLRMLWHHLRVHLLYVYRIHQLGMVAIPRHLSIRRIFIRYVHIFVRRSDGFTLRFAIFAFRLCSH
jgi:hypothetical protein